MAFNLGAFAGGLAQGGLNTYTTLKEQERRDQEAAQRAQEFEWRKAEKAREAAIEQAAAETQAKVGGTDYAPSLQQTAGIGPQQARALAINTGAGGDEFDRAVAESVQGVLRENAQRQGAALPENAPMVGTRYTQEQADTEYINRLRGISRKAAREEETGALGLKAAQRQERYAVNQENALGFQSQIMKELQETKGDIGAIIEKHFIPLYNENKLPGLNDGGTAKLVPSAMGGDKAIVITSKDGKETQLPANIQTLQMLTGKTQELMMASSSPESYWKHKEQSLKERQVGVQETELAAKLKADLFGAQAKQAIGAANASNAHAGVYNNMVKLSNENKDARAAMKPYLDEYAAMSPEDQAGSKGQSVLLKGATAAAQKSGDITGIVAQLKKPDVDQSIKVNADGTVTKGGVLYVPDPNKPGDYKPAGGLKQSKLDRLIDADVKAGSSVEQAVAVPGRPLYNATTSALQRMANRPKGVSAAEASDAQRELDARKGEDRMTALPSR